MVEQLVNAKSIKTKESFFKIVMKRLFIKPPFIGEIILIFLFVVAMHNIMNNTVSINNLGTICSSIADKDEIKEYKDNITNKIIADLERQGLPIQTMGIEEDLENYAGVNLIKLEQNHEGKNLIKGIELTGKENNNSTIYDYLDGENKPIEVEYSYFYTKSELNGIRYYARVGDLVKNNVTHGSTMNKALFNSIDYSSEIQIPISNLTDPFLVKQSIPLYLYASTYNKEIANGFINNDKFDSKINFKKYNIKFSSNGIEEENIENCKIAEVKININYSLEELKKLKEHIFIRNNILYIKKYRNCDEEYFALYPEGTVYIDSEGWLRYEEDDTYVVEDYEEAIGNCSIFPMSIPYKSGDQGYTGYTNKTIDNLQYALFNIEIVENAEAEELSLDSIGQRVWVDQENGKYALYEQAPMPYYTAAEGDMDIYLLEKAETWFGNFYFDNNVHSSGGVGPIDFITGRWLGAKINTTCRYEVNEEAKNAILDLFNYSKSSSSLTDLNLFASFIEKNAIENDDYNLKLVYYGLCRMFEGVEGVDIPYNDEIEEEFGNINNLQIATVPDYAYNILLSSANIPNPYPLAETTGMWTVSTKIEKEFREFTSPYGACYRKDFPTQTLSVFTDLGKPSGFTLEEFYAMGERFAQGRSGNLKNYGYNISEKDNLEYCLKLAETCYNLEQDVGINGILILGMATKEGGWGASKWSVEHHNLWGYGIFKDGDKDGDGKEDIVNHNTDKNIYPEELNEKYKEEFQKCAYQYACYLKIRYLTDSNKFNEYLRNLKVDEDCNEILNRVLSNEFNLCLESINNTGNNLTEEEFEKLISNVEDEDMVKILKARRYWNGFACNGAIGGFCLEYYGPTIYGIDGIYVRGWRYENKEYGASTYTCMLRFYNRSSGGGSYAAGNLNIKQISSSLVDVNGEEYKIVDIIDLFEFVNYINANNVSQDANSKYSDSCLSFAYSYVYYLAGRTNTELTAANCNEYRYASNFKGHQLEDKSEALEMIYDELVGKGLPVVAQVNGGKKSNGRYTRHFVAFVGIKKSAISKRGRNLTGDEFMFIDVWNGNLSITDLELGGTRWIFNAKEEGGYDYNYYVLPLK